MRQAKDMTDALLDGHTVTLAVGADEARRLAEGLRKRIAAAALLPDGEPVTVSIGLAFHRPGLTLREVLRTADRRVYYAKACGRNRVIGEIDTLQAAIV